MFSLVSRRAARQTCACTRTFASSSPIAAPAPSPSSSSPANRSDSSQQRAPNGTDQLLTMLKGIEAAEPSVQDEVENPSTILRHLTRNQVISPQHLSPRTLLVPYPPQPNFSRAFPLGPPTSYGPTHDPFVRYGIDPLDPANGAMNPWVASEFVTSMGKIKARGKTGLQRKSQRKIGKAIRRARSMGILPTFGISVPSRQY